MKVEKIKKEFEPICITLESEEEVKNLKSLLALNSIRNFQDIIHLDLPIAEFVELLLEKFMEKINNAVQ